MTTLYQQFENALIVDEGERVISDIIKKNPRLLAYNFSQMAEVEYVISEFPFGSEFRADFVTLGPFSGAFEIHFIELEPPSAPLFNKDGSMAKRLNKAVEQINSWSTFVEKNRATVIRDLRRFFTTRELARNRGTEPTCSVGWNLSEPRMLLSWRYDIVIGRRAALSAADIERKTAFGQNHNAHIMTYDRLLEASRKYDLDTLRGYF